MKKNSELPFSFLLLLLLPLYGWSAGSNGRGRTVGGERAGGRSLGDQLGQLLYVGQAATCTQQHLPPGQLINWGNRRTRILWCSASIPGCGWLAHGAARSPWQLARLLLGVDMPVSLHPVERTVAVAIFALIWL